jgi:hypothetical protein
VIISGNLKKICNMLILWKKYYAGFIGSLLLFACFETKAQGTGKQVTGQAQADTFDITRHTFVLPQALPPGKFYHSLGVLYVVVPRDWAHDIVNAPMFSYSGKYTLPMGFNAQFNYTTLIISNRIVLGPWWNYDMDHFHFGVGYGVAFNFGFLNQFGFNTYLTGWEQQPSLAVGYNWQRTALVLRGDLYWTNALYITEGKNTIPYTNGFINGYSFSVSFDQRLYSQKVMTFGVKMDYIKYHVIAWPAFPVNQYRYWVPEFQLTLTF